MAMLDSYRRGMDLGAQAMTTIERAEKIHTEICSEGFSVYSMGDKCVKLIAAQIEEAEKDAVRKAVIGSFTREYQAKFDEGFHAAREKAAEIAETLHPRPNKTADEIADCIRAMEVGK